MRLGDRLIGILIGIALGLAIIAIFVFVLSEDAIDPPGVDSGAPTERRR